jgi:hypothetical protein
MEFGQSDHFKSWAKAKGAALCPTVNYNHTLNSESKCYVRITKEHLRCTFGSYYIGHLPRKSKLVENTTLDDCGLDGAFLVSDHSTPAFWMWSFKSNKPMKNCDGIFNPAYPFRNPSVLQHPGDLSHEDICAMHEADGGCHQNDVSVPQYDLRSPAAPVHDAPSHAASIEHRQQVDASNVIGDANAPQGQTRA